MTTLELPIPSQIVDDACMAQAMDTLKPTEDAAGLRVGHGLVEVQQVRGRSVVVRDRATSPLKLLCPMHGGGAAWVYAGTFGGGLVAGDAIELDLRVGDGAVGVLTTQAAGKVFHRQGQVGCEQTLRASVGAGGLLVIGPDPVTCFADARYEQHQTIDLHPDASLVLVDWMTSGRAAMGERWAMDRYISRNDIRVAGKLVIRDAVRLDAGDATLGGALVTGGYHCLATVILAGPGFEEVAEGWERTIARAPLEKRPAVLASVSRLPDGMLLRLAGQRTQDIAARLHEELAFLSPRLGRGLWERKW